MALTKIGSIGINTGIQFAGVTTIATLNASDNVLSVGGTVNFASDVSIGGTLTYEDVTNIDAIGLITARNGIVVGSGITLSKDGDIFATGISTFSEGIAGDLLIDDKIVHRGDTNTSIRFPSADTISAETGGSEALRINSGQKFLIGSTSMRDVGGSATQSVVQIEGTAQNRGSISLINNQASASPPSIRFGKTRGTSVGAVDAVTDGDSLGQIRFSGSDGTDLEHTTAMIVGKVNGSVSSDTIPTVIAFETSATNNSSRSEKLRIDSSGRVLIGHTAPSGDLHGPQTTTGRSPFIQLHGANASSAGAALISWKNQAGSYYAPTLYLAHSGSDTIGTNGVLPSNGEFGSIVFSGDDGTDFVKGAMIKARLDGTPGDNDMPGRLEFHTTPDGAQEPVERLRILSGGIVLVGATATRNVGGRHAALQIQGIDGSSSALSAARNSANASGPHLDFAKTRGSSLTSNTVPNDGDSLGEITFSGGDGTDTVSMGVRIRATLDESNGAVGVNSMPGKLSFQTSSAGNQNPTERLAINSAGISTFFNDVTIDCRAADPVNADLFLRAGESGSAQIYLIADDGDDDRDYWRMSAMAGFSNRLIFFNSVTGSPTDVFSIATDGSIRPGTTNQANLGSDSYRWANIYTNDLNLSNKGSTNNVDGTWGDYTIQEGETDLYLINNRSGKKYKFNLTEVS